MMVTLRPIKLSFTSLKEMAPVQCACKWIGGCQLPEFSLQSDTVRYIDLHSDKMGDASFIVENR